MAQDEQWVNMLKKSAMESDRSWGTALALSFFLGVFGADRFYLGYALFGFIKFFTLGGFGLWYVIDIILLLIGYMTDAEGKKLQK
jgi:TM2 domain-containing membrane protein YozV